jgi:hypothetical protein
MCCDSAASSDSLVEAGAPGAEVEVTPEMVRRGIAALESGMIGGEIGASDQFKCEVVVHVFRAMLPPGRKV